MDPPHLLSFTVTGEGCCQTRGFGIRIVLDVHSLGLHRKLIYGDDIDLNDISDLKHNLSNKNG